MQGKRAHEQSLVANQVGENAEEDDCNTETDQSTSGDAAEFTLGEAELTPPICQNATAHSKPNTGCDQCEKTSHKQGYVIRLRTIQFRCAHIILILGLLEWRFDNER